MEKNEKKITTTAEFINEVQNALNGEKTQEVKKTKSKKEPKEVKAQKKEDKTSKKKTKKNEKILKEVLTPLKKEYDYILIDCKGSK